MTAQNVLVENNIFAESSVQQMDLPHNGQGNRIRRNIVYYSDPNAALLIKHDKIDPLQQCDYNIYFQTDGKELKVTGVKDDSFAQWQEMGFDTHSLVTDPMFVDFQNGDYRLKPNSPARALGFQPIDTSRIGLSKRPTE